MQLLKWLLNLYTFGWYGRAISAIANQQLSNNTAQKALDLAKNAREVYRAAPPKYVFIKPFEHDDLHYLGAIKSMFESSEMRFFMQCCKEDAVADIKRGMPAGIAQKACGWLEGFGVVESKAAAIAQAYEAQKAAQNEAV